MVTKETSGDAQNQIEDLLHRLREEDPELEVALVDTFHADSAATDSEEEIVKAALEARSAVLEEPSRARGFEACCDMRLLTNQGGIPAVILGPGPLNLAHKTDEWVSLSEVEKAAEIYERLAASWMA
jgi:acetylornithine deacetylase/succinyl-diaminopimelate desuccinylase-like protein